MPRLVAICLLLVLGAVVFCTGIRWGLPSRAVDPFLFGDRTPWTGQEIIALAGGWESDGGRGADVDLDAIKDRGQPVVLNDTDAKRAAIVRRYRLYSYQPDEMVTFRALASMRPGEGKLDPHLYQYGGLWVYPVGACLKAASLAGFVTVKSDVAYYLDHPEQFGRFYIVARLYTVLWAVVGVVVVFELTRRLSAHPNTLNSHRRDAGATQVWGWALSSGCPVSAALATLCYILMPVVVNMAHEAKPHLPGAVLMLAAVLAAVKYVDTGRRFWWLASSVLCGAAFGMVLTAWPILAVPPLMAWLRWNGWSSAFRLKLGGIAIAILVFFVTNPYVGINLICDREVLRSNLGNTAAMFQVSLSGAGLVNAARLVGAGASSMVAIAGCIAAIAFLFQNAGRCSPPNQPGQICAGSPKVGIGWLLAAPAVICLVQFSLAAAGKPGEYGRFAIFPDICLAIATIVGIGRFVRHRQVRGALVFIVVLGVALPGTVYLRAFTRDCGWKASRIVVAKELQRQSRRGGKVLGMLVEPAPYACPPMDVFSWEIRLLPQGRPIKPPVDADVLIRAWQTPELTLASTVSDEQFARYDGPARGWVRDVTPISWADKLFEVVAPQGMREKNGATSPHAD